MSGQSGSAFTRPANVGEKLGKYGGKVRGVQEVDGQDRFEERKERFLAARKVDVLGLLGGWFDGVAILVILQILVASMLTVGRSVCFGTACDWVYSAACERAVGVVLARLGYVYGMFFSVSGLLAAGVRATFHFEELGYLAVIRWCVPLHNRLFHRHVRQWLGRGPTVAHLALFAVWLAAGVHTLASESGSQVQSVAYTIVMMVLCNAGVERVDHFSLAFLALFFVFRQDLATCLSLWAIYVRRGEVGWGKQTSVSRNEFAKLSDSERSIVQQLSRVTGLNCSTMFRDIPLDLWLSPELVDISPEASGRLRTLGLVGDRALSLELASWCSQTGVEVAEASILSQRVLTNAAMAKFFDLRLSHIFPNMAHYSEKKKGTYVEALVAISMQSKSSGGLVSSFLLTKLAPAGGFTL